MLQGSNYSVVACQPLLGAGGDSPPGLFRLLDQFSLKLNLRSPSTSAPESPTPATTTPISPQRVVRSPPVSQSYSCKCFCIVQCVCPELTSLVASTRSCGLKFRKWRRSQVSDAPLAPPPAQPPRLPRLPLIPLPYPPPIRSLPMRALQRTPAAVTELQLLQQVVTRRDRLPPLEVVGEELEEHPRPDSPEQEVLRMSKQTAKIPTRANTLPPGPTSHPC